MPQTAAEQMAVALERMRDKSLSDQEHEQAVEEYVLANKRLLDKFGVERRPSVRIGNLIALALIAAIAVSMFLNFQYSTTASKTAREARSTSREARKTSDELALIQRENVVSARETCERSNDARVASIKEKRQTLISVQKQLAFWEAALRASPNGTDESPPEVASAFYALVTSLREEEKAKEQGIEDSIASIAAVAIKKGSARADCVEANPLPGEKNEPPRP